MGEIEEWFEREFGHLGFDLTPTMYNPNDFSPQRGVIYNDGTSNLCDMMTHIKIIPELANDLSGGFVPLPDPVEEMRNLIRGEIMRFLDENPRDFTPKKRITKFNFINCYGEY
jgi:hypothetical protein